MTRIVGGRCGGMRLRVPARGTRPTSDRVREALFSSVESWLAREDITWPDTHVLDLFAGSGAVGLEAASRGAGRVTLVESDGRAFALLEENCATVASALGGGCVLRPIRGDARRIRGEPPATIVFLDPPYATSDADVRGVLASVDQQGLVAPGALAVVERSVTSGQPWPEQWAALNDRSYGDTRLWYGHLVVDGDCDDEGRATGRSNA